MASWLRRLFSYLHEQVVDTADSPVTGRLEVWLAYGRLELNGPTVNYSFGELHKVFREGFAKLRVADRQVERVLLLGLGAGSVVKLLREAGVKARITAVELDPVVVRLGKKHFGLGQDAFLDIREGQDALQWLPANSESYDLVVVDLFVDDKVPEGAGSPEFLQALGQSVAPGGLLVWNRLSHDDELAAENDAFLEKMARHMAEAHLVKVRGNAFLVWERTP